MDISQKIRTIPHWPAPGVMFRDITTLLQDPAGFRYVNDAFYERYHAAAIDIIVSIDARGFIFGAVLAYRLGIGFVPVRKQGKLPGRTISQNYALEYGENILEIHDDAITADANVLIVDDLLATGGTAAAAIGLVERLGGRIHACAFVVELPDLQGRKTLSGYEVYSMVQFAGD